MISEQFSDIGCAGDSMAEIKIADKHMPHLNTCLISIGR